MVLSFFRPMSLLEYYFKAWRLIHDEPADVYHCHDLNTLLLGYLARNKFGGKLIFDAHELSTELAYLSCIERRAWRMLEKYLIYRVDAVIVTGKYRGEYLSKKYNITPPNVILNCPAQPALNRVENSSLRDKLAMRNPLVPIILYQGGFTSGRGLENLVRAMHNVDSGVLVFMGWGPLKQELIRTVVAEGLDEKVLFADPVLPDELVAYTASATLGVVIYQNTSLNNYYATPNKLYEYISAGLPVVSSNFPALKEIVDSYGLGVTFNAEEPESIAAAINAVLSDDKKYAHWKGNARHAAEIFSWEHESVKLLDIYRTLAYREA